jgi:hypothetical protein
MATMDTRTRRLPEWASLGGVAFVVLFVIGTLLMFSDTPMGDDPPSKVIAYFGDSGHRDRISIAWVVAGLGFLCFLFFVAALRETVARLEGDGLLATLTAIGGAIYAALGLAAFSLEAGVRTMSDDTFQHRVYPELIHAADDASWMIHAAGGAGLAVMIIAVSMAFVRSAEMPSWLGWIGVVGALAALASIVFFPVFVWLLWVLVVSVLLFARGVSRPAAVSPVS